MNQSFSLLFYLKKPKKHLSGSLPIYVRIVAGGQRVELSLKRKCLPDRWNSHSGRIIGSKEDVRSINSYIDSVQTQIYAAYQSLLASQTGVTALGIKHKLNGTSEKPYLLLEIFKHHNVQFLELVGKEFAFGTYKKYQTCFNSLESFLKWKYKVSDFSIKDISFKFLTNYEFYLKSVQKIAHNTSVGYIKKLKKVVRQCLANGWIDKDPFIAFKLKTKEVNRGFLSNEELNIIIEREFSINRLAQVRDLFVFSCFTGLAYSDVVKLTTADLLTGNENEKWICTTRTKTKTDSMIPLLPPAIRIMRKYQGRPDVVAKGRILPSLSNERINSYLKEIANICGITKKLSFHIARHTFATTVTLSNGVPIESVSKMLGHKSLRTTQQYAKILDKKVNSDMQLLGKKYIN